MQEMVDTRLRIAALEMEFAKIATPSTDETASNSRSVASGIPVAPLVAISQEVFATIPTTEVIFDPEEPEYRYLVLTVTWDGEPKEVIRRRLQWHDRVRCLLPDHADVIRLSVVSV